MMKFSVVQTSKYNELKIVSTIARKHLNKYDVLTKQVRHTDTDFGFVVEEPFRAILLHSPGRKPWVNH